MVVPWGPGLCCLTLDCSRLPSLSWLPCLYVLLVSAVITVQPQHDNTGHSHQRQSWRPPWPAPSLSAPHIAQPVTQTSDSSSDHVLLSLSDISVPVGGGPVHSRHTRSLLHPPPPSFQCLQSHSSDNVSQAAAEICGCEATWARAHMTLHHPSHVFRSTCWPAGHSSSSCLPPVLTPGQLANIQSQVAGVCHDQVSTLLTRIMATNSHMEESLAVLLSGHRMVECDLDNSHCQSCMVSSSRIDPMDRV